METTVTLNIKRSSGEIAKYCVPFFDGLTLLTAIRYVWENLDATLGFRNNHCGRGVCTACLVKLDGKVCRSCCSLLALGGEYLVEPANDKVIKDLIVEL